MCQEGKRAIKTNMRMHNVLNNVLSNFHIQCILYTKLWSIKWAMFFKMSNTIYPFGINEIELKYSPFRSVLLTNELF